MKNPKEKGNIWEREISRKLSLWWSNGENKNIFWRSTGSGSWFTGKKKEGVKVHSGDIVAIDPVGNPLTDKISIETKSYKKEVSLLFEVLFSKKSQILTWWGQCERDATDAQKHPWLIVKFNNRIPFIVITREFYSEIAEFAGKISLKSLLSINLDFSDSIYSKIIFLKLDDFLKWCSPEIIKKANL